MKRVLFVLALTLSISSIAAEKRYVVKGKEVTASQAVLASLNGEKEVFKCTQVEAKSSKKSGNVSLKSTETE